MSLESDGRMILRGENRRTRRKTCPSATLPATNPTWCELIRNASEIFERMRESFMKRAVRCTETREHQFEHLSVICFCQNSKMERRNIQVVSKHFPSDRLRSFIFLFQHTRTMRRNSKTKRPTTHANVDFFAAFVHRTLPQCGAITSEDVCK
jgi:hypothetical protein